MADPEDDTDFAALLSFQVPTNRAIAHIDDLRTQNRDLRQQLSKAADAQSALQKLHDDLEKGRDQLLASSQKEAEDAAKLLERQAAQHRESLHPIIEENHSLKATHEKLQDKLKTTIQAKERLRDGNEAFRDEIKDLEGQKETKQKEIDAVTQQLVAKKNEVYDADQTIKELRSTKSSLQHTIELKDKTFDELQREKHALHDECESLHSAESLLREDLRQRTEKVKAAEAEQTKLSKSNEVHQATIKELKAELNKKNFQSNIVSVKDDKIRELNDSIRELSQDLEAEKNRRTHQIDLLATRNAEIQGLNEYKDGAAERLRQARDDLDNTKTRSRAMEVRYGDLETQRDTLAAQLEQCQKSKLATESRLAAITEKLRRAEQTVEQQIATERVRNEEAEKRSRAIRINSAQRGFELLYPVDSGRRFNTDSVTYASGKWPDHGSSLRELWLNLNEEWTTRESDVISPRPWTLTTIDLSDLSSDVVRKNIGYQDLPVGGRMTSQEQQEAAAQLAEVHEHIRKKSLSLR